MMKNAHLRTLRALLMSGLVLSGCTQESSNTDGEGGGGPTPDAAVGGAGGEPVTPDAEAPDAAVDAPDAELSIADAEVMEPDAGGEAMKPMQDECGDVRMTSKVYYGTREPTHLPLSPGQVLAVGSFQGCSGTLIAPTWVLTAQHCGIRTGREFCMGEDPDNPNRCLSASRVYTNPSADMALVQLSGDATEIMPGVEPIPIITESMADGWVGQTAEAAGYGQTHDGRFNTRYFTAEPIAQVQGDYITINGQGERGVCFGDSGGPLMVIASDGSARVAGDLSYGDESCVGFDNFTRVDLFIDWIEGYTGPTQVDGAPCGNITAVGRCQAGYAVWCGEDGTLTNEQCPAACGWDTGANGFRCIEGDDPCEGYDALGACDGEIARWCENGEPRARDCGSCALYCEVAPGVGSRCTDDPCASGELDYRGRCNGNIAEWCGDDGFQQRNCEDMGQTCQYVNRRIGYFCR